MCASDLDNAVLIEAAKKDPFVLEKVEEKDLIKTMQEVLTKAVLAEGEVITELFMPISWDDGYVVQTQNGNVSRIYLIKRSDPKKSLDFNIVGSFLESHGAEFIVDTATGGVTTTSGRVHWLITNHQIFLKAFTELPVK